MSRLASATAAVEDLITYRLDQQIRYEYEQPVVDLHQRLVVVPRLSHVAQRRLAWTLDVDGAEGIDRRVGGDRFGNTIVEIAGRQVSTAVSFTLAATVAVGSTAIDSSTIAHELFLSPTRLTQPSDEIRELARAGVHDPAAICAAVHGALRYEWGATGVRTTAADALSGGVGVCQDFAHVMVAASRAAGIPARYVSGHLTGEGGTHAWVEVLTPSDSNWVATAWDPTHDRRVDSRYVTVAFGRDYADVAPMSGTYRGAGATNRLSTVKTLSALGTAAA